MGKISACIWLNDVAEEAAAFYTTIFPNSRITATTHYSEVGREFHGHSPGSVMSVVFEVDGFRFTALNGGAVFAPNPSISFFVHCETVEMVHQLWESLSRDGSALMPLDSYPFSERYGWVQDRFGVSWQLILASTPEEARKARIVPSFLFVGDICGKAEEAMNYYASVFPGSRVGDIARYGDGFGVEQADSVMYGEFFLSGQKLTAMDSADDHAFSFTEGVSLIVDATTQEEIDSYWNALSAVPDAEQCGWLKDRYGVSWQIFPETEMERIMNDADAARRDRVLEAMFRMKKIDLDALRRG